MNKKTNNLYTSEKHVNPWDMNESPRDRQPIADMIMKERGFDRFNYRDNREGIYYFVLYSNYVYSVDPKEMTASELCQAQNKAAAKEFVKAYIDKDRETISLLTLKGQYKKVYGDQTNNKGEFVCKDARGNFWVASPTSADGPYDTKYEAKKWLI